MTSSNSLIAFSFTPSASITNRGPTVTSPNSNYGKCAIFAVSGMLFPIASNSTGASSELAYSTPTLIPAFVQLAPAGGSVTFSAMLSSLPSAGAGYISSDVTYYLLCEGYTVTNHLASSADISTVTAAWS